MLTISASEMARLVHARKLSSCELVEMHLRRIRESAGSLNAAVEVFADEALTAAFEADALIADGKTLGPLHGIPFSVKDSIDVKGHRTTAGTVGFRSRRVADEDATVVSRLRQAGGIPIAKTNLPDLLFAYESDNLLFGRTNNPYDLERTPGGSSGGESALISACGSPFGLGSDAAGSVRVPAAFCGIASIKPTSGCLPRTGHLPEASGWIEALWQIGPMARYVEDLQLALELLAGEDGRDFTSPPADLKDPRAIRGLRLAFFRDNRFAQCTSAVQDVVVRSAEALGAQGMRIEEQTPPGVDEAYELEMRLLGADGGEGIENYLGEIGSDQQHWLLHAGFLQRIREFRSSLSEFSTLWARWDRYRARMMEFFSRFDAVLCPVYTEPALIHGESAAQGKFEGFSYTMAWNVSGNPAAVVRCGELGRLPINVQVITPRWKDQLALRICAALEERFGGWQAPEPDIYLASTNRKDTGDGTSNF